MADWPTTLAFDWAPLHYPATPWVLFNAFVVLMLVLDLFVFHRKAHVIRVREALAWVAFWVALALAFAVLLYFWRGPRPAVQFLTGYVVEQSLSVDNLFVFLLLFAYFRVPGEYQHRVLFWGILGAVVMRIVFIVAGVALINRLHWVLYIFGAFLVYAGLKMSFKSEEEVDPEKNLVLRLSRRFLPVSPELDGGKLFTRQGGRLLATPLFVVLLVVETTDVIFAVDSVPAVIGVIKDPATGLTDPFLAYTSNIFAILGLRAMYFALAGLMGLFHLLHFGLAAILVFVGVKMVLPERYDLPPAATLSVIAGILALSVAASLLWPGKKKV
jgi:tellurite resistance protein TerC